MTILDGTPARTLRLDLEYDGSGFVGWQSQAKGRTVQQELQKALRRLLQQEVTPMGAGRTDAGTHAVAQVRCCHARRLAILGIQAWPFGALSSWKCRSGMYDPRQARRLFIKAS